MHLHGRQPLSCWPARHRAVLVLFLWESWGLRLLPRICVVPTAAVDGDDLHKRHLQPCTLEAKALLRIFSWG